MAEIRELLGKQLLFFDGATGTQLQKKGLQPGEAPEEWNFTHPEKIEEVHRSYLDLGANFIKSNTFGANRLKLARLGLDVKETIKAAVAIGKKACAGRENKFVALNVGPTGRLLEPYGDLPFEEAISIFKEMISAGVEAGVDCILIETQSDIYEIKAAVLAAKETCDLPIFVTVTFDKNGKMLTGGTVEAVAAMCEGLGVDAIGFNCGLGPREIEALVPRLFKCCNLPVILNPNAGLPRNAEGKTVFDVSPEEYAMLMYDLTAQGASIVGGCCGTTPEHIKALMEAVQELPAGGKRNNDVTIVSSYGKAVELGADPMLIGERLNPTGKKRLKEALVALDLDYICRMGIEQVEAGAQILDVNCGTPGIDEAATAAKVVPALQAITDAPLQIDTSNYEAMELTLRLYNGRPMLNSVNGKEESLKHVLPLAKKYGAVLVALCLDDSGIPESAEGRIAIAERIIARAAEYGIPAKDIVVDPLAMTISTGADNAKIALEVIKTMKARGIRTVMGVSNISFGLPGRDAVNSTFFSMALAEGLTCGIINPQSVPMQNAYQGYRRLAGFSKE